MQSGQSCRPKLGSGQKDSVSWVKGGKTGVMHLGKIQNKTLNHH